MKAKAIKPILTVAAIVLVLIASFQPAFGISDIVYDPTNYANAILQLGELVAAVEQLRIEYELLLQMTQIVPVDMGTRYRAAITPWFQMMPPSDYFGLLTGWIASVNSGADAYGGYSQSTEPLDEYGDMLARLSPETQQHLKNRYASVELADGINLEGMQTVGMLRMNASQVSETIQGLEDDSLSDIPEMNTEIAVLNKVNAASIIGLRNGQDTNKLLTAILEQQIAASKRERDAATRELNAHMLRVRDGMNAWAPYTSTMSNSVRNLNVP